MAEPFVPPPDWVVPDGYQPTNTGSCRSCGAPLLWAVTVNGRRAPLDPSGVSHFATCPQAFTWRKKK